MNERKFHIPTAYTILFLLLILVAAATWIIPAGSYDYVDGVPVSGTYHPVEQNPQGVGDVLKAAFSGFYDAVDVCIFILIVGGFLGVVMKTGAVDAGVANIIRLLGGREKWLIPILMILFGLGGTTYGMWEETMAFYPLLIPVFLAAGYDAVVGISVILLGAGAGVIASTVNPFATGIAAGFAGVSLGQGIGLRLVILFIMLALSIWFVMSYAQRVWNEPGKSLVADMRTENSAHFSALRQEEIHMTGIHKLALALFALTFLVMIYAVIPFQDMGLPLPALGWWFPELSALFLGASILLGLCCGLAEGEIVNSFVSGAAELLSVAFIIGVSRGITVIMSRGQITDTILNLGERALTGAGSAGFLALTYLLFLPLSFLIPSTSGLAALSMPIMAPLADFAGVGRALVITAFQSASGLVNLITPTSAVVMGALALGRVPFDRWLRFTWKLLLLLFAVLLALLMAGTLLQ